MLEHRYHVMHFRLPDKHNVVNHFGLQAFLPNIKTKFSKFVYVLLFFFYCYFVVFQGQIAASSNFILAADIVQSQVRSGFFLPGLVYDTEYFPLQGLLVSTGIYISKEVFKSNISRKFSYCATILLNLLVKIMHMLVTYSFLVCCRWSQSKLYTVVHKL